MASLFSFAVETFDFGGTHQPQTQITVREFPPVLMAEFMGLHALLSKVLPAGEFDFFYHESKVKAFEGRPWGIAFRCGNCTSTRRGATPEEAARAILRVVARSLKTNTDPICHDSLDACWDRVGEMAQRLGVGAEDWAMAPGAWLRLWWATGEGPITTCRPWHPGNWTRWGRNSGGTSAAT